MHPDRIAELVELLPVEPAVNDRFDLVPKRPTITQDSYMSGMIVRIAAQQGNPKFPFVFATSFVHSGLPLPADGVKEEWIRRAYKVLTRRGKDRAMEQVLELYIQSGHAISQRINALVIGNAPREYISALCQRSEEVVEGYEKLFFDMRDRLNDHLFISSYLYPDGRYEDTPAGSNYMRIARVAHQHGWKASLDFMGVPCPFLMKKSSGEYSDEYMKVGFIKASRVVLDDRVPDMFFMNQAKSWIGAKVAAGAQLQGSDINATAMDIGNKIISDIMNQTRARLGGEGTRTIDVTPNNKLETVPA